MLPTRPPKAYGAIGPSERGIDEAALLKHVHGRRALEVIQLFAPIGMDVAAEYAEFSRRALENEDRILAVPGAQLLLEQLLPHEWAIVTSAQR